MTQEDHVELVRTHTFVRKHATGSAKIELHVLQVERGEQGGTRYKWAPYPPQTPYPFKDGALTHLWGEGVLLFSGRGDERVLEHILLHIYCNSIIYFSYPYKSQVF